MVTEWGCSLTLVEMLANWMCERSPFGVFYGKIALTALKMYKKSFHNRTKLKLVENSIVLIFVIMYF